MGRPDSPILSARELESPTPGGKSGSPPAAVTAAATTAPGKESWGSVVGIGGVEVRVGTPPQKGRERAESGNSTTSSSGGGTRRGGLRPLSLGTQEVRARRWRDAMEELRKI